MQLRESDDEVSDALRLLTRFVGDSSLGSVDSALTPEFSFAAFGDATRLRVQCIKFQRNGPDTLACQGPGDVFDPFELEAISGFMETTGAIDWTSFSRSRTSEVSGARGFEAEAGPDGDFCQIVGEDEASWKR